LTPLGWREVWGVNCAPCTLSRALSAALEGRGMQGKLPKTFLISLGEGRRTKGRAGS
jgi:hypothetical protein